MVNLFSQSICVMEQKYFHMKPSETWQEKTAGLTAVSTPEPKINELLRKKVKQFPESIII